MLRIKAITNKSMDNYVDKKGPIILVIILIISMITTVIFTYKYYEDDSDSSDNNQNTLTDDNLNCDQIIIPGIISLFNQFSGVAIESNIIYIASSYKLIIYNLQTQIIKNIEIRNYDLEEIIINPYSPNSVFLLSEGDIKNELITVNTITENYYIEYKFYENITGEGLTYDVHTNSFLLGHNSGKISGVKSINKTLELYYNIDSKYIDQYISNPTIEEKKIASLTYNQYSKYLFVLYDNAKKLVIWNINDGRFIGNWNLPGNSKQWEGIDTIFIDNYNYDIYLAKDTPPEIWKFKFNIPNGFYSCAY